MKKRLLIAAIVAASTLLPAQVMAARQAGDIIVRAGAATVDPSDVDSDEITLDGTGLDAEVNNVDSNTQLGLTATWMVTDKFGLELLAATPFDHDIRAKGLEGLGIRKIGDTSHLPPTLSVQYHFMGGSDNKFQPFVGAGLNYTNFFDEDASKELETALGEKYDLDLDDSWGVAVQAGVDYFVTDNIALNATVWWIDIETDATLKGEDSGTKIEADSVEIDPWVYLVGVAYKF